MINGQQEYYNKIISKLKHEYGESICICKGNAGSIQYNVYDAGMLEYPPEDKTEIAIYIKMRLGLAVVWNIGYRRRKGLFRTTCTLGKSLDNLLENGESIKAVYKKLGTAKEAPYEKVLVVRTEYLSLNYKHLYEFMQINQFDDEFPKDMQAPLPDEEEFRERKRISAARLERDRKFREKVLAAYNNQCAICRCSSSELLQAAHIKSVRTGGNDDVSNGICLCANHHLMFDHELISFDWHKGVVTNIDESVKNMPWYEEFMTKYEGHFFRPQDIRKKSQYGRIGDSL